MQVLDTLAKLRSVVGSDAYAGTFQSFGQYRTALLKHIDNQAAAAKLAGHQAASETNMNSENKMPLAAIAYQPEHPFPVAVRRVDELERALQSGVVINLDGLTTYTASPNGGMRQDPQGPWVTKLDVMGRARSAHPDGVAIALFSSKMHERMMKARKAGRSGWESPAQCTTADLARLLMRNVSSGDYVSVANYAMMLEHRGAGTGALTDALDDLATEEALSDFDEHQASDTFAQALIAQGWHNPDPDCVDGLKTLLAAFLLAHDDTGAA